MTKEEMIADLDVMKLCATAEFEAYEKVMEYTKRMWESCERKKKEAEKTLAKGSLNNDARLKFERRMTTSLSAESAFIRCNNAVINIFIERKKEYAERANHLAENAKKDINEASASSTEA